MTWSWQVVMPKLLYLTCGMKNQGNWHVLSIRALWKAQNLLFLKFIESLQSWYNLGGGDYTNDRVMKVRKSYLSSGPKWNIMSQGSWICHIVDKLVGGISIGCWFCHLPKQFVTYKILRPVNGTLWSWFCQTNRRVLCMCAWQNQPHKPSSLTY
jgi:hypothetical protein